MLIHISNTHIMQNSRKTHMYKPHTYIESHASSFAAKAGEKQQNKRDQPRAGDENNHIRGWREKVIPGHRD